MKTLSEALNILGGSKSYKFQYNEEGRNTVLVVIDYHTGESLKLDLSLLDREMLETLQVDDEEEEFF